MVGREGGWGRGREEDREEVSKEEGRRVGRGREEERKEDREEREKGWDGEKGRVEKVRGGEGRGK